MVRGFFLFSKITILRFLPLPSAFDDLTVYLLKTDTKKTTSCYRSRKLKVVNSAAPPGSRSAEIAALKDYQGSGPNSNRFQKIVAIDFNNKMLFNIGVILTVHHCY
jgi:hypothetical protein